MRFKLRQTIAWSRLRRSFLRGALCFLFVVGFGGPLYGANRDGANDLGVDYTFLCLMTLSPDFAAANYTINNDDGTEVDVSIGRFPYHVDLFDRADARLQLELSLAYQWTTELIETFPMPGENIDAEWDTYGASVGLLYEHDVATRLRFAPSIRLGIANMTNHADYNGAQTNLVKDLFEGTLLNWQTNAAILNLGLGVGYGWTLGGRASTIKADVYHVIVDSYHESDPAVSFTEQANMLALKADMVFPTHLTVGEEPLDVVVLMGANEFFGENRRTLGYTRSYSAGLGGESPMRFGGRERGRVRLSGQVFWANNMSGWQLTIGYSPTR